MGKQSRLRRAPSSVLRSTGIDTMRREWGPRQCVCWDCCCPSTTAVEKRFYLCLRVVCVWMCVRECVFYCVRLWVPYVLVCVEWLRDWRHWLARIGKKKRDRLLHRSADRCLDLCVCVSWRDLLNLSCVSGVVWISLSIFSFACLSLALSLFLPLSAVAVAVCSLFAIWLCCEIITFHSLGRRV